MAPFCMTRSEHSGDDADQGWDDEESNSTARKGIQPQINNRSRGSRRKPIKRRNQPYSRQESEVGSISAFDTPALTDKEKDSLNREIDAFLNTPSPHYSVQNSDGEMGDAADDLAH
jgi:hypothetical protein